MKISCTLINNKTNHEVQQGSSPSWELNYGQLCSYVVCVCMRMWYEFC